MTATARPLQIAERFDRLAWRQSLRGSEAIKDLSGTDYAVLWFAYDHADGMGEVDLPKTYIARQTGISSASVKRSIRRLASVLGLIQPIRRRRGSRVARYRLAMPTGPIAIDNPSEGVTHDPPINPKGSPTTHTDSQTSSPEGFKGEPDQTVRGSSLRPEGGHPRPAKGVTHDPQSRDKSREQSSSRQDPSGSNASPPAEALPRPVAGAVLILESVGIGRQAAEQLAQRYALTRREARNVRANIRAARRAGTTIDNAAGWARRMVERGEVNPEQRVRDELDRRRQRREAGRERAKQRHADQVLADQRRQAAEARAEAERRFDALPQTKREQLEAEVLEGITFNVHPNKVRDWSIDLMIQQEPQQ